MSNNSDEIERKKRFTELRKKAEEAEKNKSLGPKKDKSTIQTGVGRDKFASASSTLAGVFSIPKTPQSAIKRPIQQSGVSSRMKAMQAELEKAKKLDEENVKKQAEVAPITPSAQEQPVAPGAPAAPAAPEAPSMDVPTAPAAPEAPSEPVIPSAPTAPDISELIKERKNAKPTATSGSSTQIENKAAKAQLGGTAAIITSDVLKNVQLKKSPIAPIEETKPSTPAGSTNIAAEAAKRRAEMLEKRKAEGGGPVTPKAPVASAAPKLTEAQIKAQERANRVANPLIMTQANLATRGRSQAMIKEETQSNKPKPTSNKPK